MTSFWTCSPRILGLSRWGGGETQLATRLQGQICYHKTRILILQIFFHSTSVFNVYWMPRAFLESRSEASTFTVFIVLFVGGSNTACWQVTEIGYDILWNKFQSWITPHILKLCDINMVSCLWSNTMVPWDRVSNVKGRCPCICGSNYMCLGRRMG